MGLKTRVCLLIVFLSDSARGDPQRSARPRCARHPQFKAARRSVNLSAHIQPLVWLQEIRAITGEPLSSFTASQAFLGRLKVLEHLGYRVAPEDQMAVVYTIFLGG